MGFFELPSFELSTNVPTLPGYLMLHRTRAGILTGILCCIGPVSVWDRQLTSKCSLNLYHYLVEFFPRILLGGRGVITHSERKRSHSLDSLTKSTAPRRPAAVASVQQSVTEHICSPTPVHPITTSDMVGSNPSHLVDLPLPIMPSKACYAIL